MKRAVLGAILVVLGLAAGVYIEVADPLASSPTNETPSDSETTSQPEETVGQPSGSIAISEENISDINATVQIVRPENVTRVRVETGNGTLLQQQDGTPAIVNVNDNRTAIFIDVRLRTADYNINRGKGTVVVYAVGGDRRVELGRQTTISKEF